MNSNLLDEKDAAARLNISITTLRTWRSTKRYPLNYLKIGRCVRYRPSDIEAFMDSRTISVGSEYE